MSEEEECAQGEEIRIVLAGPKEATELPLSLRTGSMTVSYDWGRKRPKMLNRLQETWRDLVAELPTEVLKAPLYLVFAGNSYEPNGGLGDLRLQTTSLDEARDGLMREKNDWSYIAAVVEAQDGGLAIRRVAELGQVEVTPETKDSMAQCAWVWKASDPSEESECA